MARKVPRAEVCADCSAPETCNLACLLELSVSCSTRLDLMCGFDPLENCCFKGYERTRCVTPVYEGLFTGLSVDMREPALVD
uniref:Uncharacterized protein n=1 Tax=Sphaerodactylus townsendi TaxID=933632 RepID=A0ACB8ECR2_9SAUR